MTTLPATRIGGRTFRWGERTFVMGIVNVTPDSFSGDGLLGGGADPVSVAVDQARRMVEEGADLLDVGGESTRPGHEAVDEGLERDRVVPVVEAIRRAVPDVPISIDTTKPSVAAAAIDAGVNLLNDVWGVRADNPLLEVAARRRVPIVLMHNREVVAYQDTMAEVVDDLRAAVERARSAGIADEDVLVDPGFGFGKAPDHNLEVLRRLGELRVLQRPILLGTSRKSTLGKVLGELPPGERLEATLVTTALGVAAGADIVRVHDVLANVRAARTADAIIRAKGGRT